MPTRGIGTAVRNKNQFTIPKSVAQRLGIEPGQRLVILDSDRENEFMLRVIRQTYAGALAGVYGTTGENVAYARGERQDWD